MRGYIRKDQGVQGENYSVERVPKLRSGCAGGGITP